jgi:CBS domain-containing protein
MEEKKFLVSDYMQTKTLTLSPNTSLKEAVRMMIESKTNGAVVVGQNNKVVGILSSWDIIQYIVPEYLEQDMHLATFESGDIFAIRTLDLQNDPISKFMSTSLHTCKADHSIMEAATLLSEFHIRQLPVVDDNEILVGYINRTDIKRAVGNVLGIVS